MHCASPSAAPHARGDQGTGAFIRSRCKLRLDNSACCSPADGRDAVPRTRAGAESPNAMSTSTPDGCCAPPSRIKAGMQTLSAPPASTRGVEARARKEDRPTAQGVRRMVSATASARVFHVDAPVSRSCSPASDPFRHAQSRVRCLPGENCAACRRSRPRDRHRIRHELAVLCGSHG